MVCDMVINMATAAKKITANLPDELLKEAQKVTGLGITETLIAGLQSLRRLRAYSEFEEIKGKIHLNIDLDLARERNRR